MERARRWKLVLTLVTAGLVALWAAGVGPAAVGSWLVLEDPPARVDAVVVLAGDPDYERTRTAARIVLAGEADLLVLTGGEAGPGDSARSLLDEALRAGVPREQIRLEEVSRSTRTSLVAVRGILEEEGVATIALVTSPYHQRRAFLAARNALPAVGIRNMPAVSAWSPEGWWRNARSRRIVLYEYSAIAYYWVRGWL